MMDEKYARYWNTWRKPIRNYLVGAALYGAALVVLHAYLVTHWS